MLLRPGLMMTPTRRRQNVPASALRQRDGNLIRDRAGNTIQTRST